MHPAEPTYLVVIRSDPSFLGLDSDQMTEFEPCRCCFLPPSCSLKLITARYADGLIRLS